MRDGADRASREPKTSPRRGTTPPDRRLLYRVLIVVLSLVLAALQFRLWIGDGSVAEISRLQTARENLEKANDKARARNDAMQTQVNDLKQSDGATEARAREEMGMIRPGETFFLTVPSEQPTPDRTADDRDEKP